MSKIKTIIADDEPLAREKIRILLAGEKDIEIIGECSDGNLAVSAIRKLAPDLLFLDVQMPELDGFGVLKSLAVSELPSIIFVTAYDRYALEAFEVHALDFLLKPFDRGRFQKALKRARVHIEKEKAGAVNEKLLALLEDLRTEKGQAKERKYLERLVLKSAGRVTFLRCDEIDWIEAAGNYLRLHVGRESHLLRDTMNSIEAKLNPQRFIRIHRSTIVQIDRIKDIQPWFHGEYRVNLENGKQLTSSRSYHDELGRLMENSF